MECAMSTAGCLWFLSTASSMRFWKRLNHPICYKPSPDVRNMGSIPRQVQRFGMLSNAARI